MIYNKEESLIVTKKGVSFTLLMVKVAWKKTIVLLAATNLLPEKVELKKGEQHKVVKMDMSSDMKAAFLYNRPGQEVLKLRVNYVFDHPEYTTCRVYHVGKHNKSPVESWDKGLPMYFDPDTDEPYTIYIKKLLKKRFKAWGIKPVFKNSELLINPLVGKQSAINKPKLAHKQKENSLFTNVTEQKREMGKLLKVNLGKILGDWKPKVEGGNKEDMIQDAGCDNEQVTNEETNKTENNAMVEGQEIHVDLESKIATELKNKSKQEKDQQ